MKKPVIYGFIIAFFIMCLLPVFTLGFSKDTGDSEKRELSTFPKIREEGKWNAEFFSQFDTWITEHMGLRSQLIRGDAAIKSTVFKESAEENVILGDSGWLYYSLTADDYRNLPTITKRNAANIAATLQLLQDYCEANGAKFVFTVAPNKNTLYGSHMPYNYGKLTGDGNLELVTNAMKSTKVSYADLVQTFRKDGRVLYQEKDSHWNYEGALLAYQTILGRAGVKHDLFDNIAFEKRNDWDADLENMFAPGSPDDELQSYPKYDFTYETKGAVLTDEALTIESYGPGEGKLLMFRDSFGNTMWPYFAETFSYAQFSRVVPYRMETVKNQKITTVVLEIVERNLPNLASMAPVMEAPSAELTDAYGVDLSNFNQKGYIREMYGFTHVYGTIPESILGEEYEPILVVKTKEGIRRFRAFPVYEKSLLKSEVLGDNGYSAYLPVEKSEVVEMSLVVVTKGETYANNEIEWVEVTEE